jgi:DNA primase large subunit
MSIPDLMRTILAVFLHDIGMAPEENYIKAWKNQLDGKKKSYSKRSKKNNYG